MMLVGRTALSVEISTRCSTPNSAESSATFLVPSTLFVTASAMLPSISGTCLCAAAWNTLYGRYSAKMCDSRSRSLTSAMIGTVVTVGKRSVSSESTSKMEFSPWPSRRIWAGSRRASCRHSSLPIEPPAPVTSTVSPVASERTCSKSV